MDDSTKANSTQRDGTVAQDLPRNVLDNLLEGCQVVSPDYRYLYVNDAVVRHGRSSRSALIGRSMMEAYPGIENTEMFSLLRRCMAERSSAQMENRFTFPDGTVHWFELRFEPVPEGMVILSVDINERKLAEASLQRSVRALTFLSRSNQTLVRAEDEQVFLHEICRIVVESDGYRMAWVGLLDPDREQQVVPVAGAGPGGREDSTRAALAETDWFRDLVAQALGTRNPVVAHIDATDAGQAKAPLPGLSSCIVLPIGNSGAPFGVLTICSADPDAFGDDERTLLTEVAMDLGYGIETLRARQEQAKTSNALEQAQARTRAIYDHLPHAIFVWRRQNHHLALVDFNDAARTATDGLVATLLDQPLDAFGSGVPHLAEDLARCIADSRAVRRETECRLPGATEDRRMVLTYGFIPPDMVLLHAQDITDQRHTEEQLVAAQRLEAVGRLAGGVAHDFNNMLSVIQSYSELAINRIHPSDPIRRDIEQILDAGERAATLTRQLLAFSRKQVLEPRVTSLNQVIGGIEKMIGRLLGEDIDIEVHKAEDLGNVMADPGQLEQVIMNLVVNARDAMPKGGRLTIETANVEVDQAYAEQHVSVEPGHYIRCSVADSGMGMSPDTAAHIFEPFFTTKEKGKGTGLGLSTVYGIVKQSGGAIWVYSEPGQGTTFKIYLPRVDAPAVDHERLRPSAPATGDETILLVEDEPSVRQATERILRSAGYQVLAAANGAEALLLGEKHAGTIHLLLTDVVMPEQSGPELAQRLAEANPSLKVLYTSGYTDDAIVHHGVLDAGTHFIGKPFSIADLTRKVRQVLDHE